MDVVMFFESLFIRSPFVSIRKRQLDGVQIGDTVWGYGVVLLGSSKCTLAESEE